MLYQRYNRFSRRTYQSLRSFTKLWLSTQLKIHLLSNSSNSSRIHTRLQLRKQTRVLMWLNFRKSSRFWPSSHPSLPSMKWTQCSLSLCPCMIRCSTLTSATLFSSSLLLTPTRRGSYHWSKTRNWSNASTIFSLTRLALLEEKQLSRRLEITTITLFSTRSTTKHSLGSTTVLILSLRLCD